MEVLLRVANELDCSPRQLLSRDISVYIGPADSSPEISRGVHPFDDLVRQMNRARAIISQEGIVLDVNAAMESYRGIDSSQMVGRLLWEIPLWEIEERGQKKLHDLLKEIFKQHVSMLVRVASETRESDPFRIIFGYLKDERSLGSYATIEILEPNPSPPRRIPLGHIEIISRWS